MKQGMIRKILAFSLGLLLIGIAGWYIIGRFHSDSHYVQRSNSAWNLILVNEWNPIPKGYTVDLLELSNGKQIDKRIYPDLQEMFDAARANGVYPVVGEGYRTEQEQQDMMDEKIQVYLNEGYSEKEAKDFAEEEVAVPGTSEHQLGLAVDINADTSQGSENETVYSWLADHAWEYGFILRYPANKTELTGITYEPWHYRYVGKEAAETIHTQGICMEEYLA